MIGLRVTPAVRRALEVLAACGGAFDSNETGLPLLGDPSWRELGIE